MHPLNHSFPNVCHHISKIMIFIGNFITKLLHLLLVTSLLWVPGSWLSRGEDSSALTSRFFLQDSNTAESSITRLSLPIKERVSSQDCVVPACGEFTHMVMCVYIVQSNSISSQLRKKKSFCCERDWSDVPLLSIIISTEPQIACTSHWFIQVLWDPNGCPLSSFWFSQV